MGAFLCNGFAHVDNIIPVIKNNHMAAPVKVARQQTTPELCLRNLHQHVLELFGTFRTLLPEATPTTRAGTLQNPPEPSETFRNQPFGTFRNLPPEPTPAYAGTLGNLHCFTSELSGTFRNPPPEPTPAPTHAGTLRNLPEPSSGTCSCDPHRHTPELIWAEDPISLRCWGNTKNHQIHHTEKILPQMVKNWCFWFTKIITSFDHSLKGLRWRAHGNLAVVGAFVVNHTILTWGVWTCLHPKSKKGFWTDLKIKHVAIKNLYLFVQMIEHFRLSACGYTNHFFECTVAYCFRNISSPANIV